MRPASQIVRPESGLSRRLAAALRRRQRRAGGSVAGGGSGRHRNEDGFALMAVLAVIAITSIMIAALMGMLITTMRITAMQEESAREQRAADGAVTAAINHLRLNQTNASSACEPGVPSTGFTVPFERVGSASDVVVTCAKAADQFGTPGGELKLVGGSYQGGIASWKTAWPWGSNAAAVSAASLSLIHSGPEPLRINGNANVVAGAAAVRNPTSGTPAIDVRGSYTQGQPGVGGTGTSCGMLGTANAATTIKTAATLACGAAVPPANGVTYAINPTLQDAASRPTTGNCPSGPVVTFDAGRYDRDDVETLNRWFSGACPGRTFYFPTGIYTFDASASTGAAADRNALIFNDASSSFVFGKASTWSTTTGATATDFPNACQAGVTATAPGASIVLTARTEFRHLAGRLAVCPFVSSASQAYPAILQLKTAPSEVVVTNPTSVHFLPQQQLTSNDSTNPAVNRPSCVVSQTTGACTTPVVSFEVTLTDTGSATSSNTQIVLTGSETTPNTAIAARRIKFNVTSTSGTTCQTDNFNYLPNTGRSAAYRLDSGTGGTSCAGWTADRFNGAKVRADIQYDFSQIGGCYFDWAGFYWVCPTVGENLQIWRVQAFTGLHTATAGTVSPGQASDWTPTGSALTDAVKSSGGGVATMTTAVCQSIQFTWFNTPFSDQVCDYTSARARSLTLGGFTIDPALAPTDNVSSLGVLARLQRTGTVTSMTPNNQVTIVVRDGTTELCRQGYRGLANNTQTVLFQLPDTCLTAVGTVQRLQAATVEYSIEPECAPAQVLLTFVPCAGVDQPKIDQLALQLTTDTYGGGVTKAQLNINATPGATGSSANFFGPAYMPNTALDIYWNGAASGASIFGGELQLFSLGSSMASASTHADVVCCTKPEVSARTVRVTATIDNIRRLSVAVSLPSDPAQPPVVLDWVACGRNGACT